MKALLTWIALASAASLAGCGSTGIAPDGAGYARLTPNAESRVFILDNDDAFARQVAAHNAQCARDAGCRK